MGNTFYLRLALSNIRHNKSIYLPYIMAGTLIVILFYSLNSLSFMIKISEATGRAYMSMILSTCAILCFIMSLFVLFYINSFIIKRRKKEFALYSILGMEKKHLSSVMLWEVFVTGSLCILGGILLGALFGRLLFLLFLKIIGFSVGVAFQIPISSAITTLLLYGTGFLLLAIYDIISIRRADPVVLLISSKEGEREPKAKWFIAFIGLASLAAGYVIAATVPTPTQAINRFFPAVLLVIIGTYALFTAGSIVFLKMLKKNKHFYYKPKNFISVSGMMYRMKQNAVGLANICILSTCVLVTLSATVSLFIGEEDILRKMYPKDIKISCIAENGQSGEILQAAAATYASKYNVEIKEPLGYTSLSYPALPVENSFDGGLMYETGFYSMNMLLLSDYNRIFGESYRLAAGEILLATDAPIDFEKTISFNNIPYSIKGIVEIPDLPDINRASHVIVAVMPDFSDLELVSSLLDKAYGSEGARNIMYYYSHNVAASSEGGQITEEYYTNMRAELLETVSRLSTVKNIDTARNEFYELYGSLMFVGIFFVLLFLIATVLIIYYKQITEGFDDYNRFRIMQNVGMSDAEVRKTINKQVLMVFFLPLGLAFLHIIASFPVLCKLLYALNLTNTTLFFLCSIGSVLLFAVFYFIVYLMTSKTYYRIVQRK